MVLPAQERGLIVARGQLVHGGDAVGVILRRLGDGQGDFLVAGELEHHVADGGDVIGAGGGADPGAAPVIGLRALADRIVSEAAVAHFLRAVGVGQGVAQQGEVDAPGGVEEAEHLSFGPLIGSPHAVPQAGLVVVSLIGIGLGLLDPLHDVGVDNDGGAVHPGGGNVVGEGAEAVVKAGEHLVSLFAGLGRHGVELIPIAQLRLNLIGIVGAQHVLGDGAAVGEQARGRLPGHALEHAVGGGDFLGIGILIGQVLIGQADVGAHVQCVGGIDIFEGVVGFDEEDVDFFVGRGVFLRKQGGVQLILVVVVRVGVDGPFHKGAVVEGGGGFIFGDFLHLGIKVVEAALEFVIPAPDVEHLALLLSQGGKAQRRQRQRKYEKHAQSFFHGWMPPFYCFPSLQAEGILRFHQPAAVEGRATVAPSSSRQGMVISS